MTTPASRNESFRSPHRSAIGRVPRWLIVFGAVSLIGIGIDLFRGPHASAVQAPVVHAAPDHTAVDALADAPAAEPGASIAAYGTSAPEPAAPAPMADDTLPTGASIAAYER